MLTEPEVSVTPEVDLVTDALFSQLMSVMGLKRSSWITRSLYPVFHSPAQRMATLMVELDRNSANSGWNMAVRQFTSQLVGDVQVIGAEAIPGEGPLMVVCNHPAAYDVAILAASIRRNDLKILASDIPILKMLPNVFSHIIPVPYDIPSRLQTVRSTIQHLKNSGAILIFPRGNVEPDPVVSPGAIESLSKWSPSLELFLRQVPQTISVVAIASGMLSAKWFKNPLIDIWKKYEQRQKVAEIFQIASQLFTGRKPVATPKIKFSKPLGISDLGGGEARKGAFLKALTEQARELLQEYY